MSDDLTRRRVLGTAATIGAAGLTAATLAACSSDDSVGSGSGSDSPAGDGASDIAGEVRVKAAEVPDGGGTVVGDVVVVNEGGDFRAFSAICPHQGCSVDSVAEGAISCPCHGSRFSTADGSVLRGPATRGLATATASVNGDEVVVTVV